MAYQYKYTQQDAQKWLEDELAKEDGSHNHVMHFTPSGSWNLFENLPNLEDVIRDGIKLDLVPNLSITEEEFTEEITDKFWNGYTNKSDIDVILPYSTDLNLFLISNPFIAGEEIGEFITHIDEWAKKKINEEKSDNIRQEYFNQFPEFAKRLDRCFYMDNKLMFTFHSRKGVLSYFFGEELYLHEYLDKDEDDSISIKIAYWRRPGNFILTATNWLPGNVVEFGSERVTYEICYSKDELCKISVC